MGSTLNIYSLDARYVPQHAKAQTDRQIDYFISPKHINTIW